MHFSRWFTAVEQFLGLFLQIFVAQLSFLPLWSEPGEGWEPEALELAKTPGAPTSFKVNKDICGPKSILDFLASLAPFSSLNSKGRKAKQQEKNSLLRRGLL